MKELWTKGFGLVKNKCGEEKSLPQAKNCSSFANISAHAFVVHAMSNKMFFRCKVCLQAHIFIDENNHNLLNMSRGSRMS